MDTVDLLIRPHWLIPVEPASVTLEGHAVAVKDGRIVAVLPDREARECFRAREEVTLPHHVLIPGLVNLHTHAAMTLMRGLADDLPLMTWLQEHIWPAEAKHVSANFVHDGTLLAAAEMLRGGITCFNDMYFFPHAAGTAAARAGIRAVLGLTVLEFPTNFAADADDYIAKGLAARDTLLRESAPHIHFALAPHAPYTVSDRSFSRIATIADELDLPIHTHLHETRDEIEGSLKQYGVRPLERLRRLGLLGPNLVAVHAVHLDPAEIALIAANNVSIAHCPASNLKLASGIAPVRALLDADINVGIGTDGAASNNRLDVLAEMRLASLLAKGAGGDASTPDAHRALRMATLAGAQALGLGSEIGSIMPGKWADLCAIDLSDPLVSPCYSPVSHLAYVAGRENVSHVWVGGQKRVENGALTGFDKKDLANLASIWQTKLCPRKTSS